MDDGKVGTEHQCVGLARALGIKNFEIFHIKPKTFWTRIPPRFWINPLKCIQNKLPSHWPDLVIGGGRRSAAPVAHIRKISRGKTKCVQLLNPHMSLSKFDYVIVPDHDSIRGKNIIPTLGALNTLTKESIQEGGKIFEKISSKLKGEKVAVLLGGSNKIYHFTREDIEQLVQSLEHLQNEGYALMITPSRRTDPGIIHLIKQSLKPKNLYIWDQKGPNPYFGMLEKTDYILVTKDSVSMTSEACFTGKPVFVIPLQGGSKKFERFHNMLVKNGYTRKFEGNLFSYTAPVLAETPRVAEILKRKLGITENSSDELSKAHSR